MLGTMLALGALCLALISLAWPFGPDHAIMTLVGRAWRHGVPPYTALVDVKGPVAYLPYLLGDWMTQGSMSGIRVLDLVLVAAASVAMYRGLTGLLDRRAARWSALLLFAFCFRVGYIESMQPDEWVALGTAAAFPALLRDRTRTPLVHFVACGLLAGLAALIKPQFAVLGAIPLIICFRGMPARGRTISVVVLMAAAVLPVVIACGVLLAQGALDDMLSVATGPLMREYVKDRSMLPTTSAALRIAVDFPLFKTYNTPLILLAILGLFGARRLPREVFAILLGWLAGALLLVISQGRYFPYHWFPVLPPLCILAGIALADAGQAVAGDAGPGIAARLRTGAVMGALGLLTLSFAGAALKNLRVITQRMRGGESFVMAVRSDAFPSTISAGYASNVAAGAFLRARTHEDEAVGTWLYDPSALVLGHVMPNTPQFFVHPVLSQRSRFVDSVLRNMADEVHRESPRFFVLDCSMALRDSVNRGLHRAPALRQELERNYARVFVGGETVVLEHRDARGLADSGAPSRGALCSDLSSGPPTT
jgi:hypothetical protein